MKNPYLVLKIEVEKMKKIVDFLVKHGEFVRETYKHDNEQSKMFEEKLSLKRKTRIFRNWTKSQTSRQDKSPNTLKTKFFKNFLNVFCD